MFFDESSASLGTLACLQGRGEGAFAARILSIVAMGVGDVGGVPKIGVLKFEQQYLNI